MEDIISQFQKKELPDITSIISTELYTKFKLLLSYSIKNKIIIILFSKKTNLFNYWANAPMGSHGASVIMEGLYNASCSFYLEIFYQSRFHYIFIKP